MRSTDENWTSESLDVWNDARWDKEGGIQIERGIFRKEALLTLVASESVEKCVVLSARASKNVTCLISFLEL